MRLVAVLTALLCIACGRGPASVEPKKPDPTTEPRYNQTVGELEQLNRAALAAFENRKSDEAADLITRAQPLMNSVIGVPRPTLAAAEAASDLDDLYGRMLLANNHVGWARLQFQKNVARWTNWQPETESTRQHLKQARERLAECDRRLAEEMLRP